MSATLTPDRSVEQRLEGLRKANRVRSQRAGLKRDLKAGRKTLASVLLDPPEFAGSMKVFELILAAPRVGEVKANKAFGQARVSLSKTLGGLTERQRGDLAARLAPRPRPARAARVVLVRDPVAVAEVVAERRPPVRRPRSPGGRLAAPAPRQPWEAARGGCGP